jgi:lipopolysaccharide biosynthesis glycosyltransferase
VSLSTVPTLFCINAHYAQHVAVCIASLLENNPHLFFDIVVACTGDLGSEEEKLSRSVKGYRNCTLRIERFTTPRGVTFPVRAHYSVDTYTRLSIAEFFPEQAEKALYLDSDMVVVGSIDELWQTDVSDVILAAVPIPGSDRCAFLGIPDTYGYLNAGVMVINLARWRGEKIFDRLLDYIVHNPEKLIDADQDVLNGCLYDRWRPLPYVWNVISPFFFDYHNLGISDSERTAVRDGARIVHFNGASKPWSYLSRHPRKSDYTKYLMRTEWRDYVPPDRTLPNWVKKHLGPFVPESVRDYVKRIAARATG